jgi:hypothetical protein
MYLPNIDYFYFWGNSAIFDFFNLHTLCDVHHIFDLLVLEPEVASGFRLKYRSENL